MAPRRKTNSTPSNLNTWIGIGSAILSTIIAGVVMLMINGARETSKKQTDVLLETKDTVTVIKTEIPHIKESITTTEHEAKSANEELKDQRTKMVTREELSNKHAALQQNIDKGQAQVHELANKLDRVQEELWQERRGEPTPRRPR